MTNGDIGKRKNIANIALTVSIRSDLQINDATIEANLFANGIAQRSDETNTAWINIPRANTHPHHPPSLRRKHECDVRAFVDGLEFAVGTERHDIDDHFRVGIAYIRQLATSNDPTVFSGFGRWRATSHDVDCRDERK